MEGGRNYGEGDKGHVKGSDTTIMTQQQPQLDPRPGNAYGQRTGPSTATDIQAA